MTDQTARFALPFIDPGQSQKEMTHNEALAAVDAALHPSVQKVGQAVPPATPAIGDQWIVGDPASADWAGRAQAIATWTAGGWRFLAPRDGMTVWSIADGVDARFHAGKWTLGEVAGDRLTIGGVQVVGPQAAAIAAPTGGAVVDVEARGTLTAIIAALTAHGLIAKA